MTVEAALPISNDFKMNRIQHHHHHHYHVHHILEHHHLHIHNQSIKTTSLILNHHHNNYQQQQQQQREQKHLSNRDHQTLYEHDDQPQICDKPQKEIQQVAHLQANQQLVQTRKLSQTIGAHHHHHHISHENLHLSKGDNIIAQTNIDTPRKSFLKPRQKSQIQFFLMSAFAYILSPIDLIPEIIFGIFGIVDDLLFLLMCLFCVAIVLLYPVFREVRRNILDKLGLKQDCKILDNKSIQSSR